MSEVEDRFVKRGFWVDRSKPYILGQTLTVEAQTGTVIVALLTILASVAATELWNIFTFLYHQSRTTNKDADGLFWQQQALLRTLPAPAALMADTLKLSWAWKDRASRSLLRCSFPFIVALCFAVASIAAGISTSFAMDNSNIEVLVDSPLCGRFNYTKIFANSGRSTLLANIDNTIDMYALNCYQNTPSLPALCRTAFHRPNISFTASPAPCPWNASQCLAGDKPALVIDAGLVDMREHFGMNILPVESVKLRRRATCNVLPIKDRIIARNASWWTARGFKDTKTTIEIGTYRNTDRILRPEATFIQAAALTEFQQSYGSDGAFSYLQPDASGIGIIPIPEMRRTDADVALLGIWLNDVAYETPVNDPLFSAHKVWIYQNGGGYPDSTMYKSDIAAGVIGCAEQYQYCVPQTGTRDFCTSWSGTPLDDFDKGFPSLRPIQRRILQLLRSISRMSSIKHGPEMKRVLAQSKVSRSMSNGLPDDQWKRELVYWEARVWATYQMLLSVAVSGPTLYDEAAGEYTEPVIDEGDKQLCKSLRMRKAGGFSNINVFALTFLIAFSTIITLCNMLILRFLIFLSRFRAALAPRIDQWVQDGVYQLHRRANEAQGYVLWTGLEREIPITKEKEKLSPMPTRTLVAGHAAHRERVARRAQMGKLEASITEEAIDECDGEELQMSRRSTDSADADVDIKKHKLKKIETKDSSVGQ